MIVRIEYIDLIHYYNNFIHFIYKIINKRKQWLIESMANSHLIMAISIKENLKSTINKKKDMGSTLGLMEIGLMATGIRIKCVALESIISAMVLSTKVNFSMDKSKEEAD